MRKRLSPLLWGLFLSASFCALSDGATITWTNYGSVGSRLAVDSTGEPLWGTMEFGLDPDLSLGDLVQLWKAVGEIDDPTGKLDAYLDLDWHVDDVLLGESHIGFGSFHPSGSWCHTGDYAVNEYDVLYVRAFNVSKPDFVSTPITERELTIRNRDGEIVFNKIGGVCCVQTYFFDNLQTRPIPEPSAALLVFSGIVLAAVKNRKASLTTERK